LAILLLFGVGLMVASPMLRRYNRAPAALAAGALEVLAVCVLGLVRIDPRMGQAAIAANRRSYLMIVAWELPVLILALLSWRKSKWAFWLGWAINGAFTVFLIVITVWLEFFWRW
jgi:hypothetical protein